MPFLKAFLTALFSLVIGVISLYKWVIIIRALISWVNPDPYNPVVRMLVVITEPILRPFRRIFNPYRMGGLDLSPIFAILLLIFIEVFLKSLLYQWRLTWQ